MEATNFWDTKCGLGLTKKSESLGLKHVFIFRKLTKLSNKCNKKIITIKLKKGYN